MECTYQVERDRAACAKKCDALFHGRYVVAYFLTIRDRSQGASFFSDIGAKKLTEFAKGLRNPNGLAWEPKTRTLWTVVNERDMLGSDLVPDYLTAVSAGDDYGWPHCYYGERDTRVPSVEAARAASCQYQRVLRLRQEPSGFFDEPRRGPCRLRRRVARDIGEHRKRLEPLFLYLDVEVHVHRTARRRLRDLRGAQQRFARRGNRARLVVPLGVVADELRLVRAGMYPLDPGSPLRRVPRAGRADDQHRAAITPRVEDRHRRVHQADVRMQRRGHHSV